MRGGKRGTADGEGWGGLEELLKKRWPWGKQESDRERGLVFISGLGRNFFCINVSPQAQAVSVVQVARWKLLRLIELIAFNLCPKLFVELAHQVYHIEVAFLH